MNPIRDKMGPVCSPLIGWCVLVSLLAGHLAAAQSPTGSKHDQFGGETAWQADAKLGKKWQEITGRFIFQRTCLSCHKQGPASFTRTEWEKKLEGFPEEAHVPRLPEEFGDLTAMFSYGRMVANDQARYQALKTFLLRSAPEENVLVSQEDLKDAIDLLPTVGQEAPDFSIVDIDGKEHTLRSCIQNKEALILVFSRAHW